MTSRSGQPLFKVFPEAQPRQARRVLHDAPALRALYEARSKRKTGELLVSIGDTTSRIYLEKGQIVWAVSPGQRSSLVHVMAPAGIEIDKETASSILEECRQTSAHFSEVLVRRELATKEQVIESLRLFLQGILRGFVSEPQAQVSFVSRGYPRAARFTFFLEDLLNANHESGVHHLPPPSTEKRPRELRFAAIPGVLGVAIVDRRTGAPQAQHGASFEPGKLRPLLALLAQDGAHLQFGVPGEHLSLLRVDDPRAVVISADLTRISQVQVMALLRELARHGGSPRSLFDGERGVRGQE